MLAENEISHEYPLLHFYADICNFTFKRRKFDLIYLCKVVYAVFGSLVKRKRKDQTKNKWMLYKLNQSRILQAALRGHVLKELLQNS